MTQILLFSSSAILSPLSERKQRWSKKLICSSRQHVWGESSLFKSRSKSGFRKFRASNSTAESYGGSAEISKGQPAPWLSTWPSKQGEPSFHLFGFLICVAATAARALKSVLQGILLSADGEKLNSMNLLLYMAPMAVVFLLPATLIMEDNVVGITLALARDDIKIIWYLLFNSSLAYFVNLTNFLVTKNTSALTLQVLGNAKGAVAVVVSILIFRNPVSVTGMFGYTLTVMGVILYSEAKKRTNKS